MDRRLFVASSLLTCALLVTGAGAEATMTDEQDGKEKKVPDRGPRFPDELVKAFVGVAHGDLVKVEAMLAEQPKLVNAVWDWGGGDFESALGGASHMGRADIARVLLAHGARMDLFAAAMLGELTIVRATLEAFPEALHTPGPHGIPLLVHARQGGEKAADVRKYLESLK